MDGFKLGEELPDKAKLSFSRILQALVNTFFGIDARGNIEQPASFAVLRDSSNPILGLR
jgi:hypothetical protein